ncbi:hypothetical protein [Streptomyces sp. AK02-01A]|uniref:hypothetical protein n=1 Tax=Streptomyces sp. AK02-01A TaxID=3028648 RepID=UPI0029B93347|nr:hypothetical protein [Streptomyces sp. AK02-01A]MDX3850330.1 hypothetical protein [Streptomyces sp. AK02-01A]
MTRYAGCPDPPVSGDLMNGARPRSRRRPQAGLPARNLPAPGLAEVRVIAESPETAQLIADVLRTVFAASEPRTYPADPVRGGTRLHLTVDTDCAADLPAHHCPRRISAEPHDDEI